MPSPTSTTVPTLETVTWSCAPAICCLRMSTISVARIAILASFHQGHGPAAGRCTYRVSLCVARRQPLVQPAKLIGNASVDEVVANTRNHPADDGGIDLRADFDLFSDQLRELLLNHLFAGRIQRDRGRDVGHDDTLLL